jgi:hypothetical protein
MIMKHFLFLVEYKYVRYSTIHSTVQYVYSRCLRRPFCLTQPSNICPSQSLCIVSIHKIAASSLYESDSSLVVYPALSLSLHFLTSLCRSLSHLSVQRLSVAPFSVVDRHRFDLILIHNTCTLCSFLFLLLANSRNNRTIGYRTKKKLSVSHL